MGSLDSNLPNPTTTTTTTQFRPLDPEEFRRQAHQMVDFIADYYQKIETYPVLSQVQPGYLQTHLPKTPPYRPEPFETILNDVNSHINDYYQKIETYPVLSQVQPGYLQTHLPKTPPYRPEPFETILNDVNSHIIPGMTHWLSPNFFAFFPATVSTAAFLGEMLCTCFNAVGFNWLASPAATELEMVVMDWLANMLKLPRTFTFSGSGGGVIQNTTSEAVLVTLIAARDKCLSRLGVNSLSKLVVYGSDQTHSTFPKACKVAGINPFNIRSIPTRIGDGFALSPRDLSAFVKADLASGLVPLYVCVTLGTTSTTAVDPIGPLAEVANEYGMWIHVDAAYGGSACICPEFRHYLNGVEGVHSFSLSPHKWLLSYLDCCCLWVRDRGSVVGALSTNPEYLRNRLSESSAVVDYKDWQVGTGRRFKSLRLWLVLRSYGVANLQSHIRSDVRLARMFEGFVKSDPRFEIMVPRQFALVCFRLNPKKTFELSHLENLNRKLLEWVNSTGRVYMTHTIVGGSYMLRFSVGATLTEERHVVAAWKLIKHGADDLLKHGAN